MIRIIQIEDEVLAVTSREQDGKVTDLKIRVIPLFLFRNIEKGFRYE